MRLPPAGRADCSALGARGWRGTSSEGHKGLLVREGREKVTVAEMKRRLQAE